MSITSGYYYLQPQCGVDQNLVAGCLHNIAAAPGSKARVESPPCLVTLDPADWTCIHQVTRSDDHRYTLTSWTAGIDAFERASRVKIYWGGSKEGSSVVQPDPLWDNEPNMCYTWDILKIGEGPWHALRLTDNLALNMNVKGDGPYVVGTRLITYGWSGGAPHSLFTGEGAPNEIWRFIPAPDPVEPPGYIMRRGIPEPL